MGLWSWIQRVLDSAVRHGDSKTEQAVVRKLTPFVGALLVCGLVWLSQYLGDSKWSMELGAGCLYVFGCVVYLVVVFVRLLPVLTAVDILILSSSVGVLLGDWGGASEIGNRYWPVVVLGLDIMLLFERGHLTYVLIPLTVLYLFAERMDAWLRYGFYDIGKRENVTPPVCDCADPPCGLSAFVVLNAMMATLMTFLGDFILTRGFAKGMQLQLTRVNAAVHVAGEIAGALAKYDIDSAEKALDDDAGVLPEELLHSYAQLLSNLKQYRDYLPDALLQKDEADLRKSLNVPPPVMEEGETSVAMVFTDIQSSSRLWEACPQSMHEALRTHNETLRNVAAVNHGYEVKIIGDALMLAFRSAHNAVQFATSSQEGLIDSEWPHPLLEQPLCRKRKARNGSTLWHGLRVRIGVNWGSVQAEKNPVTGRYDFYGTTVNIAARVEAHLRCGGIVGVTQAVVDVFDSDDDDILADCFTRPLGARELRGVGAPTSIHIVLPVRLAERWDELAHCVIDQRHPLADPVGRSDGGSKQRDSYIMETSTFSSSRESRATLPTTSGLVSSQKEVFRDDYDLLQPRQQSILSSPSAPDSESSNSQTVVRRQESNLSQVFSRTMAMSTSHRGLSLGLQTSVGSCAAVRGNFKHTADAEVGLTRLLAAVETATLRTQGQLVCVVSAQCVSAWNAGMRCQDHLSQSSHFTTLLRERVSCHAGIATGPMLSGNISGARRRHVTVAGSCVELSMSLSETAALRSLYLMATGEVGAHMGKVGAATRTEVWMEAGGTELVVWSDIGGEDDGSVEDYVSSPNPSRGRSSRAGLSHDTSAVCLPTNNLTPPPEVNASPLVSCDVPGVNRDQSSSAGSPIVHSPHEAGAVVLDAPVGRMFMCSFPPGRVEDRVEPLLT
eukprot:Hpha_TRINITY_DN22350_c0_g1::TRINITY_DN22350_c0_g1_i1::g.177695::m.177695